MLRKILNILKKASNKSFLASNFGLKSPQRHMSIFPGVELGASKDDMVEKSECIFLFLYNLIFQPYHLSSPQLNSGRIDICPRGLFCPKFGAEKLLLDAFFGILRIFASVQPKSECTFSFLYNLIFKPYHLSSPLAPLRGRQTYAPAGFFVQNLMPKIFYLKLFFGIVRILTTVRYYHRNE